MRPTTQALTGFTQAPSQVPKVGVQVAARPVALAPDDSASRQLDQLKSSLAVFQQGASNAAQAYEKQFAEGEQQKALKDFAQDPQGQAPADSSVYYYKARMGMFGESKGLDIASSAAAEAKRLQENPDELYGLDVKKHMTDFVTKQYAGLDDPVALEKVITHAQKAQADTISTLLASKQKVIETKNLESTRETMIKAVNTLTPESLPSWFQQNFQDSKGMVNQKQYAQTMLEAVRMQVQAARTEVDPTTGEIKVSGAQKAQSYMDAMDKTKVPGSDMTFSDLLFKMDPESTKTLSAMRNHVSSLAASEQALKDDFRNEAAAAQQKALQQQQELRETQLEGEIQRLASYGDGGRLSAMIQSAGFDPVRAERLNQKLLTKLQSKDLKDSLADVPVGQAMSGKKAEAYAEEALAVVNTASNMKDMDKFKEAYSAAHSDVATRAPGSLSDFNKEFFKGVYGSLAANFKKSTDGTFSVTPFLQTKLEAFSTIESNAASQVGIKDEDARFMTRVVDYKKRGLEWGEAIAKAQETLGSNTAPLDRNRADEIRNALLSDNGKAWWTSFNVSFAGGSEENNPSDYLSTWSNRRLSSYSDGGMDNKAITKDLQRQFENSHIKVNTPWESKSAGLINLEGKDFKVDPKDPNEREKPQREFKRQVELAAREVLAEYQDKYGKVAYFVPDKLTRGLNYLQVEGTTIRIPIQTENLIRLGVDMEKEDMAKSADRMKTLMQRSVMRLADPIGTTLKDVKDAVSVRHDKQAREFLAAAELEKTASAMTQPMAKRLPDPAKPPVLTAIEGARNDARNQFIIPPPPVTSMSPPPPPLPPLTKLTQAQKKANKMNAR